MTTHVTAAVVLEGVSHRYANGVTALANVSLSLEPGTITAFIGHNGSGKSTLLRLIAGLLPLQSGSIRTLGEAPHPPSQNLRARVSYLAQSPEIDPEMTVAESIALFGLLYGVADRQRVHCAAEEFGLAEHFQRRVDTLSGGLRLRLHLSLGLLHDPDLLLLDEPTAALDPAGRAFVWGELERRRAGGSAVAVITHDLAEVAQNAQEVALLQRGCLLAAGSPGALIAAASPPVRDLAAAYFQITGEPLEVLDPVDPGRASRRGAQSR